MTSGYGLPPAVVFTPDVDEIGVLGKVAGERRGIHGIPGGLELTDDGVERGSSVGRSSGRHAKKVIAPWAPASSPVRTPGAFTRKHKSHENTKRCLKIWNEFFWSKHTGKGCSPVGEGHVAHWCAVDKNISW